MRTSEFKEAIESMNCAVFKVVKSESYYFVHNEFNNRVASINKRNNFCLNTDYAHFEAMDYGLRCNLFKILTTYASTPIAEREEEKRYRLKLVNKTIYEDVSYLNKTKAESRFFLSSLVRFIDDIQNIFTESELAEIDETGFERIEVEQ